MQRRGSVAVLAAVLIVTSSVGLSQDTGHVPLAEAKTRAAAIIATIEEAGRQFDDWSVQHPCLLHLSPVPALFQESVTSLMSMEGLEESGALLHNPVNPSVPAAYMEYLDQQAVAWEAAFDQLWSKLAVAAPLCDQLIAVTAAYYAAPVESQPPLKRQLDNAEMSANAAAVPVNSLLASSFFAPQVLVASVELHVAAVEFHYERWEAKHQDLRQQMLVATRDAELKQLAYAAAKRLYDAASDDARARAADVVSLHQAAAGFARTLTPSGTKSTEYQALEQASTAAQIRIDKILDYLRQQRAHTIDLPVTAVDNLLAELDELQAAQDKRRARMDELDAQSRPAIDMAAALVQLRRYQDAILEAEQKEQGAVIARDVRLKRADAAQKALSSATKAAEEATAAWLKLGTQRPFIRHVLVAGNSTLYEADVWNPQAAIDRLGTEIDQDAAARDQLGDEKLAIRALFQSAMADSSAALEQVRSAALKSAGAQASLLGATIVWDIATRFITGGPVGLAIDVGFKLARRYFVGPPNFTTFERPEHPGDYPQLPVEALLQPGMDPAEDAALTKRAAALAVAYLADHDDAKLQVATRDALQQLSGQTGKSPALTPPMLLKAVLNAEARYKSALASGTFAATAPAPELSLFAGLGVLHKLVRLQFPVGLAQRDIAKYFEGPAMSAYIGAEGASWTAATIFQAAQRSYLSAVAQVRFKIALRQAIAERYDMKTGITTVTSKSFDTSKELQIELKSDFTDPASADLRVSFGPIPATPTDRNPMIFRLSAAKLGIAKHDAKGGLVLVIDVGG